MLRELKKHEVQVRELNDIERQIVSGGEAEDEVIATGTRHSSNSNPYSGMTGEQILGAIGLNGGVHLGLGVHGQIGGSGSGGSSGSPAPYTDIHGNEFDNTTDCRNQYAESFRNLNTPTNMILSTATGLAFGRPFALAGAAAQSGGNGIIVFTPIDRGETA